MIQLKNIHKTFSTPNGPITALEAIDLSVEAGEIYGVIGKSGAGKSTLLRCANLLEKPDSGQVIIDGIELTSLDEQALRLQRHKIGMIFQHFNLLSSRTVFENIAFPLELVGMSKREIEKTVRPLLELTGLEDKADIYPADLSGGQKQRVAIARALASKPSVLLCDEATSALDPQTTLSILDLLTDINQQLGLTILLITHEMDVIKDICDHVAVMDKGKIIETSDVGTLFSQPKSAIGRDFVNTSMQVEIPQHIQKQLHAEKKPGDDILLELVFHGPNTAEPILSDTVKTHNVDITIIQGHIETVKNDTFGMMLILLKGSDESVKQIMTHLHEHDVITEVLGYVTQPA